MASHLNNPEEDHSVALKAIIRSLLDVVAYDMSRVPFSKSSADALGKATDAEVASWNVNDGKDGTMFASSSKKAVICVEVCFLSLLMEHGAYNAVLLPTAHIRGQTRLRLVWFFFYIDDCAEKFPVEDYQRRLLFGQLEDNSALAHFHKVFERLYDHWDPVCANAMVCAAFEFISGTVLETREKFSMMQISSTAPRWPKYFREKTGMAPGFSYAVFPKDTHPKISAYIQVIPDIDDYMCLVNDILSFYKEELAGETNNYVQVRSKATLKHPNQVLVEMVQEVGELHVRIAATLEQQPEPLAAWKTLEYGFMWGSFLASCLLLTHSSAFHLALGQYKLSELGFGCSKGKIFHLAT